MGAEVAGEIKIIPKDVAARATVIADQLIARFRTDPTLYIVTEKLDTENGVQRITLVSKEGKKEIQKLNFQFAGKTGEDRVLTAVITEGDRSFLYDVDNDELTFRMSNDLHEGEDEDNGHVLTAEKSAVIKKDEVSLTATLREKGSPLREINYVPATVEGVPGFSLKDGIINGVPFTRVDINKDRPFPYFDIDYTLESLLRSVIEPFV